MQCQPQRQNDEWFCATCKRRWSQDDKPSECFLNLEENVPDECFPNLEENVPDEQAATLAGVLEPPADDLRMDLALAINGPHDARWVGPEKLRELQLIRWDRQTTEHDRKSAYNAAGAVLDVLRERGMVQ